MPNYFGPYVSFRAGENSADFAPAKSVPENALTRSSSLLLLIHGYNNNMTAASESYDAWVALQKDLGGIPGRNVVAIYWPGSNWENFAFYMQAVHKSQTAAQKLAEVLRKAADDFGILRIRIVAHSLGN